MTEALTTIEPQQPNVLTAYEADQLAKHEATIQANLTGIMMVATSLHAISKDRLYRIEYPDWDTYLEERWGFGANYGHKLVAAAEVRQNLEALGDGVPLPTAESQVRGLARFAPEEQEAIWVEACRRVGSGEPPPARLVQEVIEERKAASLETPAPASKSKKATNKPAPMQPPIDVDAEVVQDDEAEDEGPENGDVWFTPEVFAEAVREVLGTIGLDPASCDEANEVIQAEVIYTEEQDGLAQDWKAETAYMNPPFSKPLIAQFIEKMLVAYNEGDVKEAIICVNANTGSDWFEPLFNFPINFVKGRIQYRRPRQVVEEAKQKGKKLSKNGWSYTCFIYLGEHKDRFAQVFGKFGRVVDDFDIVAYAFKTSTVVWPEGIGEAHYRQWYRGQEARGITEGLNPMEFKRHLDAGIADRDLIDITKRRTKKKS